MKTITRNNKHKKAVTRKNLKKGSGKSMRCKKIKRRISNKVIGKKKFHGGTNDLGRIFNDIVINKKIYNKESENDAQSNALEQAGWKIEELTEELKTKLNDDKKVKEILEKADDYIRTEEAANREIESNKNADTSGQGNYDDQNSLHEFIEELRTILGDEDFNPYSTPAKTKARELTEGEGESPRKKSRSNRSKSEEQYEHVFNMSKY
jgi:hypothetical protein